MKTFLILVLGLAVGGLLCASMVYAQAPENQGALVQGQQQERSLQAGAGHVWEIQPGAGRYVEVEVEQQGLDVMLNVVAPTGLQHRTFDASVAETERARWVAGDNGTWQVQVVPFGEEVTGAYTVTWTVKRAPGAVDRQLVDSDSLYEAATGAYNEGRMEDTEALYLEALALREAALGPDHLNLSELLNNLALFYYGQGRVDEVEPLLKRALAAQEEAYGPDHRAVLTILTNMAEFYAAQGRYAEAEPLHKRALGIAERTYGAEHLDVATVLNMLGGDYVWLGNYDAAIRVFERALQIKEQVLGPDAQSVASTLNNLAYVKVEQGHYTEAEPLYERALRIWEQTEEPENPQVALILDNLAQVYHSQGRYDEADALFARALLLKEQILGPDHPYVAITLNNRALLYVDQGRYEEAASMYRRALEIQDRTNGRDQPDYATALDNLAQVYDQQGRYAAADSLYLQALALREKYFGPDHPEISTSLNNVGLLYLKQGRYDEAEAMLNRSIVIRERALGPDHPTLAVNIHNLATLFEEQGRYAEAEPLYRQSLKIMEQSLGPDHESLASVLTNLANLYSEQSRYDEAEALLQRALTIREAAFGRTHNDVALTLNAQGMIHFFREEYDEAVSLIEAAIAIQQEVFGPDHPSVAELVNNLAAVRMEQGRYDEAEKSYQQGLDMLDDPDDARSLAPTYSLIGLARVYLKAERDDLRPAFGWINRAIELLDGLSGNPRRRIVAYNIRAQLFKRDGRPEEAIEDMEEALRGAEEMRVQIGGDETVRAQFLVPYSRYFDQMVDWQVEQGDLEAAFEYVERGRARVLLDQLAAGKVDLRAGIPADLREDLEAREARARARLAEFQQRNTLVRARTDLATVERFRRLSALEDSLRAADRAYQQAYQDIKNASPLWRDLVTVGGRPTDLSTVQRQLVPRDGLLLLFQVGSEHSYVFAVPPRGEDVTVFPLALSEEQAAVLNAAPGPLTSDLLQAVLQVDASGSSELLKQLAGRQGDAVHVTERLHALWQLLMPPPLWAKVVATTEVVIVLDDLLHYLPFEALVVQPGDRASVRYWLDDGPVIRYAPSATALYNINQRPAPRAVPRSGEATVLSLSNAIFSPADVIATLAGSAVRIRGEDEDEEVAPDATRDSYERAGGSLSRLPGTARETDAIRAAFGGEADQAVLALEGLEANERTLRRALAGKRYLHFGTHGLVDERRGALFASLAMTPPAEETAVLENDGFLQLHEIYALHLPEVELAVLSACESNIGPRVEGEGIFALSRGFFAAGARRVIASQWSVDDASTAALMGAFFERVVEAERAGRPVDFARALWEARQQVRHDPQWARPYFWAPFVLMGKQ